MEVKETEANWLLRRTRVTLRPFTSQTPVIGRWIAWLRTQWGNVAARWLVQDALTQQNELNRLLAQVAQDVDARLIAQDREQADLQHDMGELAAQIARLNRRLAELESKAGGKAL